MSFTDELNIKGLKTDVGRLQRATAFTLAFNLILLIGVVVFLVTGCASQSKCEKLCGKRDLSSVIERNSLKCKCDE